MIALPILAFLPSVLAGFLFGLRGILVAFLAEIALVWIGFFFFVRATTGMEGIAHFVWWGIIVLENAVVAFMFARASNWPTPEKP